MIPPHSPTTSAVVRHKEDQTRGQAPQPGPPHHCGDHSTMHVGAGYSVSLPCASVSLSEKPGESELPAPSQDPGARAICALGPCTQVASGRLAAEQTTVKAEQQWELYTFGSWWSHESFVA